MAMKLWHALPNRTHFLVAEFLINIFWNSFSPYMETDSMSVEQEL